MGRWKRSGDTRSAGRSGGGTGMVPVVSGRRLSRANSAVGVHVGSLTMLHRWRAKPAIPASRRRTTRPDALCEWSRCRTPDRRRDSSGRTPSRPALGFSGGEGRVSSSAYRARGAGARRLSYTPGPKTRRVGQRAVVLRKWACGGPGERGGASCRESRRRT